MFPARLYSMGTLHPKPYRVLHYEILDYKINFCDETNILEQNK